MAVVARDVAVLFDEFDFTRYFSEFEFEREGEDIDVSTFGSRIRNYLSGPQETTVTFNGYYDKIVDRVFHARFGADDDRHVTLCPNTYLHGRDCYLIPTTQVTYNLSAEVEDAVEMEGEFRANGAVDLGQILVSPGVVSATGDGTSVVADAATDRGLTAHLHVLAVSGTTPSCTVEIEHSVDGTTWASLLTFDAATAVGSQRKLTIPTATVNKHVRATWTISGTTPSFTIAVAAARGY